MRTAAQADQSIREFSERQRDRHALSTALSKESMQMVAKGVSEDEIVARLEQAKPDEFGYGYMFAPLAAYGLQRAYNVVLQVKLKELDEAVALRTANGPDRPSTYRGGIPSTIQTETIGHIVDTLSHGIEGVSAPEHRYRDGRKRISAEEACANIGKTLEMIVPYAKNLGVDMRFAFPSYSFIGSKQYGMAAIIQHIAPEAFAHDHQSAEWLELQTTSSKSNLRFYDDCMFQRDQGDKRAPSGEGWGRSIWSDDSPLHQMESAFHKSVEAKDEAGASAAFSNKVLRASQCMSFASRAIQQDMPQLVAPLFDATKAFNSQALAGAILAEIVCYGFGQRTPKQKLTESETVLLKAITALQKRGGDINAHQGQLLMRVADKGRMDIAAKLVLAGADIAVTKDSASRIMHTDEGGGNVEYPYAAAARRLGKLKTKMSPSQGSLFP